MAAKLTKAFARATGSGTDIMGGYRVAIVDYHSSGGVGEPTRGEPRWWSRVYGDAAERRYD